MTTLTFYAIRHKPSGGYLPEPAGRMGRGGSHVEPATDGTRPRLFTTERAARIALSTWLKGKVVRASGYDYKNGDYWEDVKLIPIPSRSREDMEIVSTSLVLP